MRPWELAVATEIPNGAEDGLEAELPLATPLVNRSETLEKAAKCPCANSAPSSMFQNENSQGTVYRLDPLGDPRWSEFVRNHSRASVFHTPEWLDAIRLTYGYRPVVLTTSAPAEELNDGMVFCEIQSWLTGQRMVSLPFSDHCEPLVSSRTACEKILGSLRKHCTDGKWKYVEVRPLSSDVYGQNVFPSSEQFCFHAIDLRPDLDAIFAKFQKSSVQRKIQKAEREGLVYEEGRSDALLNKFYQMTLLTRRKHQLPPQPFEWFENLAKCMGDRMKIRLVSKDGRPTASILTLNFKRTMVYKYGCSVPEMSNLGGTPLLFWRAIQDAKALGMESFDLGRSDMDNEGLVTFKERLGGEPSNLTYLRYPQKMPATQPGWKTKIGKNVISRLPDSVLIFAGRVLYRHMG